MDTEYMNNIQDYKKKIYKAIALDLDGTLMDSNKKLPQENKEAVVLAAQNNKTVILASGRPMFGIMPVADMLGLHENGGYVLAYNGGNILDCRTGKLVYERSIPPECISDICGIAKEAGVEPLTYYKDMILAQSDTDEYVLKEAFCNSAEIYKTDDIKSFVDYSVAKFLVVGPHEKLLPVRKKLVELYDNELDVFFSEDYFLEVVPKNVKKDESLDKLMNILGIDKSELIACGDGMNDISMLRYAGLGVAMKNAYPPVKEAADIIGPSNDEAGVADTIMKYLIK